MRRAIIARKVTLTCLSCGNKMGKTRIRELSPKPVCSKCKSGLLTYLRRGQNSETIKEFLERRLKGKELNPEELDQLSQTRRTADLILSYGKKALISLQIRGIGPETAFRILGKMHYNEDEFYMDLLKAKIQYLRTRPYWKDKEKSPI
jgi:ATP-dependent Lhr-like helicase